MKTLEELSRELHSHIENVCVNEDYMTAFELKKNNKLIEEIDKLNDERNKLIDKINSLRNQLQVYNDRVNIYTEVFNNSNITYLTYSHP